MDKESSSTPAWLIPTVLGSVPLLFLMLFFKEIATIFVLMVAWLLHLFAGAILAVTATDSQAVLTIAYNDIIGLGAIFLLCVSLLAAQALLPVGSMQDIFQTALHFVLFILGGHGAAIFVKDGKVHADAKELRQSRPGVAVIDFNSALVLERVVGGPGNGSVIAAALDLIRHVWGIPPRTLRKVPKPVRTCGPGLTFIRRGERVQGVGDLVIQAGPVDELSGVVDLRRQARSSATNTRDGPGEQSVHAYTRDGIELGTTITALFTIGQDVNQAPNVLHVTYEGEYSEQNLRIVTLEEQNGNIRVQSMVEGLDDDDSAEIHKYFQSRLDVPKSEFEAKHYCPLPRNPREPVYDPARVFSAVYSRARLHGERDTHEVVPWTELPVRVAVDFFREILSRVNFDQLYLIEANGKLKIENLRKQLQDRMRSNGMLSYRLIWHRHELPLTQGQCYTPRDLCVSPVKALQTPKVLRERGIQIINSGFGELIPEKDVYLQWLASWRAAWELDTMKAQAVADLEARRIYGLARAQALQEMSCSLRSIYSAEGNSRMVVAIRVLQALETIAADGGTRRLLPADTISMLSNIHNLLLPGELAGPGPINP